MSARAFALDTQELLVLYENRIKELEGALRDTEQLLAETRESQARERLETAAIVDEQAEEIAALRSDLEQARDLLAGFRPVAERELHIHIDEAKQTYSVQRRFVREYGEFHSFKAAVARREEIRRMIDALPYGEPTIDTDYEHARASVRGD